MNKVLVTAIALAFAGQAFAQEQKKPAEGQTAIKIEDAADKKNKVDGDVDQEITNAKLRAESGSKSKFSLSLTANYAGGSLAEPLSKDRPNPVNDPIAPKTEMSGRFSGRYRLDKNQSLTLGTGYSLERPFHEAERGQVSNPSVGYNNARKLGPVQNVSSVDLTATTNSDYREVGDVGTFGVSNTTLYNFGGSKASIGMAVSAGYTYYDKENEMVQPKGAKRPAPAIAYQRDYSGAAYPFFEYVFTDKINFRTVFRPWIFEHRRAAQGFEFVKRPWTQSIGVGFAVTRDIYLYPNFQYDWEKWRRDDFNWGREKTRESSTVGLSATINIL